MDSDVTADLVGKGVSYCEFLGTGATCLYLETTKGLMKSMKALKMRKTIIILGLEAIIVFAFLLRCFGKCEEYTLDKYDFNNSLTKEDARFEGDLIYFDDDSVGIEAQGLEKCALMDSSLTLGSGAYCIEVMYDSVSNPDFVNIDNSAGRLAVLCTDNPALVKSSEIPLIDGVNETQSRFWLRQENVEVTFRVRYYGTGKLSVKSIHVKEIREYRILVCIAVICAMLIWNLFYSVYIKTDNTQDKQRKRFVIAGIIGITLFASMTCLTDFMYYMHDRDFHLTRIISLASSLKELQIPHRISFDMLNGYGYATPLYYGEIFMILPAILYNLYLPLQTCYQIFVIVVNFMTCIISYWCFMRMSDKDWKKGLLGAFMYTMAAYRLTNVMVRAAVGEYVALAFFPLMLYGFWYIYCKKSDKKISIKDCMPIILAATGIVNSHVLSCEMVLLFIIFLALINYRKTFKKNTFIALLQSAIVSFLLNMWFVIPFLQSMRMNISVNDRDIVNALESRKAYLVQLFGIFHTSSGNNVWWGTQNEMPLSIGFPLVIGIGIFIYACMKKEEWHLQYAGKMKVATECFVLGMVALYLSSLYRWDDLIHISKEFARILGMVQFPWRYLGIATVCLVAMIIFILQIFEKKVSDNFYKQIVLGMILALMITEGHFIMEYINVQDGERIYSETDIGIMGEIMGGEYLLQETDVNKYKTDRNVDASGEGIECSEFYYDKNGKYYLTINNRMAEQGYIDVPIQAYDNYHAYTNDGEELNIVIGANNKIRVLVPGYYDGEICIKYVVPVLWRLCEIISLITMCVLIFIMTRAILRKKEILH